MDLLKYLEPMKNLPDRFSNLAFWRGVRKLKDEVVNAFEYVYIWGNGIERELANSGLRRISEVELTTSNTSLSTLLLFKDDTTKISYFNAIININGIDPPENAKFAYVHLQCDISDLPNNVDFTISNFTPLDAAQYYTPCGLGTVAFQTLTGAPHITHLRNAFIFFYG